MTQPTTVLVIDDEPDIRHALNLILSRAGYTVLQAANGREGLRLFHLHHPNVTVLDLVMPGMNGWKVLDRIRTLGDSPVLMLTAACGLEIDMERGLNAGADDYLTKPFGNQQLLARIETLLRRAPGAPVAQNADDDDALAVDVANRTVHSGGRSIQLTSTELRLLTAMATDLRRDSLPSRSSAG